MLVIGYCICFVLGFFVLHLFDFFKRITLYTFNFADSNNKILKNYINTIQELLRADQVLASHLGHYCHYSHHSLLPSWCTRQHFNQDSSAVFSMVVDGRCWQIENGSFTEELCKSECILNVSRAMCHCVCQGGGLHPRHLHLTDDGA